MHVPIYHVDAFTDRPFAGNPAAVCLLSSPRDDGWMQMIAREMNLSETAFVHPHGRDFRLRWFTPLVEVDLCGHATLAAAHVLWEAGTLASEAPACFHTRSGVLVARRRGTWIEMSFPAEPEEPAPTPPELVAALGVEPRYVGRNRFDYLVEVETESVVRTIEPDLARLRTLPVRGVIVTSRAETDGYDVVSRFFAPRVGIDEDPVTGSAHCCLGPYWSERLGKGEIVAYQASKRGGVVRVRLDGARVCLSGQAVTVLRGTLLV
ncbi:MAG TPA: PhzF family phenazine biosynthesis protein [Chloroflexota bacterium]